MSVSICYNCTGFWLQVRTCTRRGKSQNRKIAWITQRIPVNLSQAKRWCNELKTLIFYHKATDESGKWSINLIVDCRYPLFALIHDFPVSIRFEQIDDISWLSCQTEQTKAIKIICGENIVHGVRSKKQNMQTSKLVPWSRTGKSFYKHCLSSIALAMLSPGIIMGSAGCIPQRLSPRRHGAFEQQLLAAGYLKQVLRLWAVILGSYSEWKWQHQLHSRVPFHCTHIHTVTRRLMYLVTRIAVL